MSLYAGIDLGEGSTPVPSPFDIPYATLGTKTALPTAVTNTPTTTTAASNGTAVRPESQASTSQSDGTSTAVAATQRQAVKPMPPLPALFSMSQMRRPPASIMASSKVNATAGGSGATTTKSTSALSSSTPPSLASSSIPAGKTSTTAATTTAAARNGLSPIEERPSIALLSNSVISGSSTSAETQKRPLSIISHSQIADASDVNGFSNTKAGKKAKKNNRKQKTDIAKAGQGNWNAEYDPVRPVDYDEWKQHIKWKRMEAEAQRQREDVERARQQGHEAETDAHSYYSSDDEELPRRMHFAPPSAYDDDRDKATESDFITQTFTPATIVPAASIDLAETAEAAYARRVALSKRTSTAAAPPPPTEILSSHIPLQAVPFVDSVDTASIIMPQRSPPAPLSLASETLSAPTSSSDLSRTTHDTEILASTSIAIMATPSSSASGTNSVKAAAEAIAAKLAALAGPDPEPEPAKDQDVLDFLASLDREDDDEDAAAASDKKSKKKGKEPSFAEKLMAAQGYVKGQGLGADNSGITTALDLFGNSDKKNAKNNKKKVKQTDEQQQQQQGSKLPPTSVFVGIRGALVDRGNSKNSAADIERFGEPSQTIELGNVCDPDEVDDELRQEIGEECTKFGQVARVWIISPTADDDDKEGKTAEGVQVRIQFVGPAAAWTARSAMDGRFFGGRTISAVFVPD